MASKNDSKKRANGDTSLDESADVLKNAMENGVKEKSTDGKSPEPAPPAGANEGEPGNTDAKTETPTSNGGESPEPAMGNEGESNDALNLSEANKVPVPTAKQIEDSASILANDPAMYEAFKLTLAKADEIIKEKNVPTKKTPEELAAHNYNRLVAQFGKDFVTAKKGSNQKYFTRKQWASMPTGKMGWTEITATMPEVAAEAKK